MTDLGFPNNPALNELFTSGWSTWMFDGVKWMASVPSGGVYEPVFGGRQFPMYGFLYQETAGDPGYSDWAGFGAHRWRFGISPGDDFAAGSIDYRGYVSDALSIVGAGATAGTRKINLYDNVNVSGNLTVGTTTILGGGGGIVSVGNITATGPLTISGPMGTTGSNAIFTFQDRTGTTNWGWYAQAGVARLWNDQSGDRITIDGGGTISTPGSVRAAGNLYLGGAYVFFSGVTAGGPFIFGGTTDIATQLGTGNGAFKWYSNPGVQLMNVDSNGNLTVAGTITPNSGVIELGNDRTSDGYAYVDFHAQPGTDFDFRIIRNPGANGGASIVQNGTAPITFAAANFSFNTAAGTGNALLEIYGTSGWDSLRVRAPNGNFIVFKPETGAGWCQIGYYVAGGWGTIEIPGNLQVDSVFYAAGISSGNNINMGGNYLTFQNSPANLAASGPMLYGDGNWIVAKPGSGNLGFMLYDNAGQMRLQLMTWGGILATGIGNGQGQFHMAPNNTGAGYGSMWYNDATTTYLLLTAVNDSLGHFNGLRPFAIDNASGNITFGNAVTMNVGAWIGGNLTVNGSYLGMPNSDSNHFIDIYNSGGNWLHIFDDGNAHIESNTRIWFNSQTGADVWFGGPLWSNSNMACAGALTCGQGDFILSRTGSPGYIVRPGSTDTTIYFCVQGGGNLANVFMQSNGLWVSGNIIMDNGKLLYGKDTAANIQWLIGLWSDNVIYVGDGSHDLHLRGYTTYCDNSNEFRCNNAIHAVGSNAMLYFDDRTDGIVWGWYAHNSVVHLYSNLDGDRVAIDRGGNISTGGIFTAWDVHANSGLFCNGLLWQNNGGWWWTGSPIHSDSEMTCSALNFGGCRLANVSGYAYFDQTTHAAGHYSRGDIWCAGSMTSGNHLQANGGGWCIEAPNGGIYCPNEVHGGYVTSGGNVYAGNDITANSVFRGTGNGGARIGNWQGSGWDWMAFAIISGGYLGVSPDQGASGFNYTPNASWSDARLKLNIRASEIDALAVIGAIPVRAFDWTEKGRELMPRDVSSVSCGLVAQELEELIPDAVTLVPVIGDLAGDPMRCIIHEQLDAYYIRAFQQLAARVEELEDLVRNERSLT